ncbi:hypothetical protein [Streptomyces mirabilis]|uniref:hypothetical protein n=1 Tax=Streptomyces mirabilis TaxID=68239 RepID=UPI0036BE4327
MPIRIRIRIPTRPCCSGSARSPRTLTANAHRIHYDTPYARDVEGYPGLVVHGPLPALLMLELVRRDAPSRQVLSLSYRLRSPVFAGEHLLARGTPRDDRADLSVATHRDPAHATAEVTFTER